VVDGQVIPSAIKHIPIAGGNFTKVILETLREREGEVPPEDALNIAKKIKV
jgi:actin-related protein 3